METIGLIAAMTEECAPLLRRAAGWKTARLGRLDCWRFELGGRNCLLVRSGVGLRRAAAAARALAAERPGLILSFGVAGAVEPGLSIGDVVAVRAWARLEAGWPGKLERLSELPPAALQAAAEALRARGARLAMGMALTTRGEQAVRTPPGELENPVLEMETAAIAEAAAEAGILLLALRGVSDNPAAPIPFDPGAVLDDEYRLNWVRLARVILRRPKVLAEFGRFRRNSAAAAENAAAAVAAALGEAAWMANGGRSG